ncbi:hypothetical protein D3C81_1167190 [compost metagenome]
MRQGVGLPGLPGKVFGGVLQARQAGFQARFLAEDGHLQACLWATAIGVHACDQRIGSGLLGQSQQAFQAALLPAETGQAERNGKQCGEHEAPVGTQPDADEEGDLADQDERQPVEQHRYPDVAAGDGRFAGIQPPVQCFGAADLLLGGLDPYRLVPDHLVVFEDRRDVGVDPVMVAIAAAVLDDAHPRAAFLQRRPHVLEHGGRHVGVAHQVVRRADKLLAAVAADVDEGIVGVTDHPALVGGGDQPLFGRVGAFALGYRLVVAHR